MQIQKRITFEKIGGDMNTKKSNYETEEEGHKNDSVEEKGNDSYITKFNVLCRFSIDEIQKSQLYC